MLVFANPLQFLLFLIGNGNECANQTKPISTSTCSHDCKIWEAAGCVGLLRARFHDQECQELGLSWWRAKGKASQCRCTASINVPFPSLLSSGSGCFAANCSCSEDYRWDQRGCAWSGWLWVMGLSTIFYFLLDFLDGMRIGPAVRGCYLFIYL